MPIIVKGWQRVKSGDPIPDGPSYQFEAADWSDLRPWLETLRTADGTYDAITMRRIPSEMDIGVDFYRPPTGVYAAVYPVDSASYGTVHDTYDSLATWLSMVLEHTPPAAVIIVDADAGTPLDGPTSGEDQIGDQGDAVDPDAEVTDYVAVQPYDSNYVEPAVFE